MIARNFIQIVHSPLLIINNLQTQMTNINQPSVTNPLTGGYSVVDAGGNYTTSPPTSSPSPPVVVDTCRITRDCANDYRCFQGRCINPCREGACAANARCRPQNGEPICTCASGYAGDPYSSACRKGSPLPPFSHSILTFLKYISISLVFEVGVTNSRRSSCLVHILKSSHERPKSLG